MPAAGYCIAVRGCVVRGGRRLYCLDLGLPCRGVVALVGANGSGKTTLLRTLAGLENSVDGLAYAARPLLYMPEEHFAPQPAGVREWLWLRGVGVDAAVGAGLPRALLGARVGRLSHGWRRFVELLAVLLSPARVYLLDEPFSGMDPGKASEAWGLVRGASERGLVVATGHEPGGFEGLVDRVYVIEGGRVVAL